MKKFLIGVLNLFLSAFIFLLLFSFYGKTIFSGFVTGALGNLKTNVVDKKFVEENNEKYDKVKIEKNYTLGELMDSPEYKELLQNEAVQSLIQKYIDTTIVGVTDPNALNNVDLGEDIIDFLIENKEVLENEYNITIKDEDIESLKKDDTFKNITSDYVKTVESASKDLSQGQKNLLKGYNFVCGTAFKILIIILSIIDIVLIALLQKSLYKWVNTLGVNLLSSGILTIIFGLILHFSINALIDKMGISLKFDFIKISIVGLVASIIGGVLMIVYFIIKKKFGNDDLEELYNDVSKGYDDGYKGFDELSADDE